MYIKLLVFLFFHSIFAATIRECTKADAIDFLSFEAKFKKLNEEIKKYPNDETPDRASLKVTLEHCKELVKSGEAIECDQMQELTSMVKASCQLAEALAGPYNGCKKKMHSSTSISDCASWFYSNRSKLSPETECTEFRQRKECIQKEVGKICGAEAEKSFKETVPALEKLMRCV